MVAILMKGIVIPPQQYTALNSSCNVLCWAWLSVSLPLMMRRGPHVTGDAAMPCWR